VLVATSPGRFLSVLERTRAEWQHLPGVKARSVDLQRGAPAGDEWGPRGTITWQDMAGVKWSQLRGVKWREVGLGIYVRAEVSQAELDAHRKRLEREIQKVSAELERAQAKLANPDFLSRAPAEVVEKNKRRADELAARQEQLKVQLGQM